MPKIQASQQNLSQTQKSKKPGRTAFASLFLVKAKNALTQTVNDDESEIWIDDISKDTPVYYGNNESHEFGIREQAEREGLINSSEDNVPTSIRNVDFDDVSAISLDPYLRTGTHDSKRFVPAFRRPSEVWC